MFTIHEGMTYLCFEDIVEFEGFVSQASKHLETLKIKMGKEYIGKIMFSLPDKGYNIATRKNKEDIKGFKENL